MFELFETQLKNWETALFNYTKLSQVKTKPFRIGNFQGRVQYNPGRAGSTLANVSKEAIKKRQCFLCSSNRPKEQAALKILEDWELLVNPFPILPFHFTIVNTDHRPQQLDITIGFQLAELLPKLVVFYNSPGAGASAPDHQHYQAVEQKSLPLIDVIDKNWKEKEDFLNLPFKIIKIIEKSNGIFVTDSFNGLQKTDAEKLSNGKEWQIECLLNHPLNAFFWISESGEKRGLIIPRKAHRPTSFNKPAPERRAFSPGAIDMAGVLVTPFEEDFTAVTNEEIKKIYEEVGIEV